MWSKAPTKGTWLSNPHPVEIGDRLNKGDLRIGVGCVPERQECLLRIDQSGVGSRKNLCLCIVQFIEYWPRKRETFINSYGLSRELVREDDELTNNPGTVLSDIVLDRLLPTERLLWTDVNANIA